MAGDEVLLARIAQAQEHMQGDLNALRAGSDERDRRLEQVLVTQAVHGERLDTVEGRQNSLSGRFWFLAVAVLAAVLLAGAKVYLG